MLSFEIHDNCTSVVDRLVTSILAIGGHLPQLSKRKRILFSIFRTPPELTLFTKLSKTVTPPSKALLTNLAAAAGSFLDKTAKVGQGEA